MRCPSEVLRLSRNLITYVLPLTLFLAAVIHQDGCAFREQQPTIIRMRPLDNKQAVVAGRQKGFTVEIEPDTRKGAAFKWSANRGKILGNDGRAVTYQAPIEAGKDTLTVEVSMGDRMLGSSCMEIEILPACPPFQIQSLAIRGNPSSLHTGAEAILELTTDPAGVTGLMVAWTAERGEVRPFASDGRTAAYRAPATAGTDRVNVEARDSCGSLVKRSLEMLVTGRAFVPAPHPRTAPIATPIPWVYDFENPDRGVMGWKKDLNKADTGVQDLRRSSERSHRGSASLELNLRLDPANPQLCSGEAAVRVDLNPPTGETVSSPLDLSRRQATFYVWLPEDFPIDGDNPHGIQLFARDANHRALYGCWTAVDDRDFLGQWRQLTLSPVGTSRSDCGGHRDNGFDPSAVRIIGLKVGLNPNSSMGTYTGRLFIDSVEVR